MGDLPFFKSHHLLLTQSKPSADRREAEHQAHKATPQSDPDNGEDREPLTLHRRQRVPVEILVPLKGAGIEPGQVGAPVAQRRRDGAGEAIEGDVEGGEAGEEAKLLGDGAGEGVVVEIDDVEVGAGGDLGGDGAGEGVGGEVEGLEVGAVGEEGGEGAGETEAGEGELEDAAVVAGGAGEEGGEAGAGEGQVWVGPVVEVAGRVLEGAPNVGEAGLVVWIRPTPWDHHHHHHHPSNKTTLTHFGKLKNPFKSLLFSFLCRSLPLLLPLPLLLLLLPLLLSELEVPLRVRDGKGIKMGTWLFSFGFVGKRTLGCFCFSFLGIIKGEGEQIFLGRRGGH